MDRERETSHTREHDPYQVPGEDRKEERSWDKRFRDIQQKISHMKVAVKGQAPVSMDALVQQTESSFTARGAVLPPSGKVQNAVDRDVRRNKRPPRPPQNVQKSDGTAWMLEAQKLSSNRHVATKPAAQFEQAM